MTALNRLVANVQSMVQRVIVRLIDDDAHTQFFQTEGLAEHPDDDVEHHQPYGFTSHPPPGSTALLLAVGGDASHPVAVNAFHPDKRPTGLKEGEVGLYDHEGRLLLLVKAGASPEILVGAPDATEPALLGDIAVTTYDAHVHPTPFGPTGMPTVSLASAKSAKVKVG